MSFGLTEGASFAGRYRVVRRLAAGAMGAVYEAVHVGTRRRLALKVMHAHILERPALRERFKLEAQVTAGIASEHIVEVVDAGIDEATGTPFLVMELLEGEELGQRLKRKGRFSSEEVLEYLHQTALALDETHRASIVHRDLKPGNLFLVEQPGREPIVKVLDFGIAKIVAESATGGGGTVAAGTPYYMAPEQFRGGKISAATDIYALGMMAYTFLRGEAYWADDKREGDDLFAFALIAARGPKELASVRAGRRSVALPPAFDAWFARATAVLPARRFASATAAVGALADVLGLPRPSACEPAPAPASARETAGGPVEAPASGRSETLSNIEASGSLTSTTEDDAMQKTSSETAMLGSAVGAPSAPSAGRGVLRRRTGRVAAFAGLLAGLGAALLYVYRPHPKPTPPRPVSPLQSPSSVLACPIFKASGVDEPSGWLGAAATATVCERARVILGGVASRTLVPAELINLPRQPVDAFPVDPYAGSEARERSLAAAKSLAAAYIDGDVTKEALGFRVSLTLHRADGSELASASGTGHALYQAVREAMTPLVRPDLVPQASTLDPIVADWSRARSVEGALALLDVTLASGQNAGGLGDECDRCKGKSADLDEMGPATSLFCAYILGRKTQKIPLLPLHAEPPASYVTRARLNRQITHNDPADVTAELLRLFEREPSALGKSVIAATASCALQPSDAKRAREMAMLAVQADAKNPLGEFCGPWVQLMQISQDTASAESTLRAIQAWMPWHSAGWHMQATRPGDADRALVYARRAYALSPFETGMATGLADLLLAQGAREEVRNIAVTVATGGEPVHKVASSVLLVRVEASEARFGAALKRALGAMQNSADDAGWVGVQRFEAAFRAVEIAGILGRASEIADRVFEQFIEPEPLPIDAGDVIVSSGIPAICALASKATGQRCFARLHAVRSQLSGGVLPETDAFAAGAERYAAGDFQGAAKAWRPLLRQPGNLTSLLPAAMATTFDRTGDVELYERLLAKAEERAKEFGGASPVFVVAARRAAARGDRENARALAERVIGAWSVADETVPAVEEMRKLLLRLR